MPVLRSVRSAIAKAVRRAVGFITDTLYGAGGHEPVTIIDFEEEFYRGVGVANFTDLVTHVRNSNAVMTDGYGPELVTNGTFDSGIENWTAINATLSHVKFYGRDNVIAVADNGSFSSAAQTLTTVAGKTYLFSVRVHNNFFVGNGSLQVFDGAASAGNGDIVIYTDAAPPQSSDWQNFEIVFVAQSTTTSITLNSNGSNTAYFDNVSVREMPVLKWAPHNLIDDSDDLTGLSGVTGATRTATVLTETTSTGSHSIQSGYSPVAGEKYTLACEVKLESGTRFVSFRGFGEGGANKYPIFNLVSGTIEDSGTAFTDVSITDVGDGYYLLKASILTSSAFTWQIHMQNSATSGSGGYSYTGDGTSAIALRKIRQYRSDLGGMVDNPDKAGHDADYVPTDNAIAYLPRIGHHVYNGSAWVNEGLLAESVSRTNALRYSNELTNAAWFKNVTVTEENNKYGFTLFKLSQVGTGSFTHISQAGPTIGNNSFVTLSAYVKAGTSPQTALRIQEAANTARCTQPINWTNNVPSFDTVSNTNDFQLQERTIQDVGDGLYRVSITVQNTTGASVDTTTLYYNQWNGSVQAPNTFVGATQCELGRTPSSFIPTLGSTVTRAAETFTIPSANLPWPSPNHIGSELVTNGTFDTASDWTLKSGVSIGSGVLSSDGTTNGELARQSNIGLISGKVYEISVDVISLTAGSFGVKLGGTSTLSFAGTGTKRAYFVATSIDNVQLMSTSSATGSVDNLSVREINPLAVSIAMDGRVTYSDNNDFNTVKMVQWQLDTNNLIRVRIGTNGSATGKPQIITKAHGTEKSTTTSTTYFAPDILLPYNIAGVVTSAEARGAEGGVAFTSSDATTMIADLSSTDLSLATTYMGTIRNFRVWDKDIGDAGLVEATQPSTEPSLSLTFEGTGNTSFVVNDWSE